MRDEQPWIGERDVILTQDDVSGFTWAKGVGPGARRYLARPAQPDFWGTYQGDVISMTGFLRLNKDPGVPQNDYSYMYQTTRMSTDGRDVNRESPYFRVQWRKKEGQSWNTDDRLRLRIAFRPVYSNGALGDWAYIYGSPCFDDHADDTWEWCSAAFNLGDYEVQDIRAFIYNSTIGKVDINAIQFEDGGP